MAQPRPADPSRAGQLLSGAAGGEQVARARRPLFALSAARRPSRSESFVWASRAGAANDTARCATRRPRPRVHFAPLAGCKVFKSLASTGHSMKMRAKSWPAQFECTADLLSNGRPGWGPPVTATCSADGASCGPLATHWRPTGDHLHGHGAAGALCIISPRRTQTNSSRLTPSSSIWMIEPAPSGGRQASRRQESSGPSESKLSRSSSSLANHWRA